MNNINECISDKCEVTIKRIKNGVVSELNDVVVNEISIVLTLQCDILATFTCSPGFAEELVIGYLVTSGIVNKKNKLLHLDFIKEKNKYDVTLEDNNIKHHKFKIFKPTGCAGDDMIMMHPVKRSGRRSVLNVTAQQVSALMMKFNKESLLFKTTGGVHSAAVADTSDIIVFREDIGRHNAIDKAVGYLHQNNIKTDDKLLLTSGRLSSEIVYKAVNAGFRIVVSHSAPTLRAVELARENDITLIGFARSINFNVYSHFNRVLFNY